MDYYFTVCALTMLRNCCLQHISGPNVINPSDFVEGLKGITIIINNIELQLSHANFLNFRYLSRMELRPAI